ncbi:MAG: radical SAM protein [Chloroflexota bacterium]|nr:radical SAM protein [Chloroflexota bacterium]
MRYHGAVIRPPSEARSYILQATYGCSHNRCTFCGTYKDKPFRVRPADEVLEDIELARRTLPHTRRVFLADGDALVLSTRRLIPILDALGAAFPRLERVGIYANARNLLRKSVDDLELLRRKKLGIVYLGLESGSDEVLRRVRKGSTAAEMVDAVHKARAAGMRASVIAILGLGGPELSLAHAEATGRVVGQMDPAYFSMLSLMLVPGTKLHRQWQAGEFQLMGPEAMLVELRRVIAHLDGLSHCLFRTNHASNYLPLAGTLPQDKARLLATLDNALARGKSALRPEGWRAL